MAWEARGLLLRAPIRQSWALTHAALPHVHAQDDGSVHLYFSSRDDEGRSQVGRVDLAIDRGALEVGRRFERLLAPGPLGTFDDSGVTTSCVVGQGGREFLYYTGWSLGVSVPFYLFAGCAVSEGGGSFERISPAPVLERNDVDPYLTASPWVLLEDRRWRMWYVSGAGWERIKGEPRHRYHIKYAESDDGVTWEREGFVCIDFQDESEHALSRPCVVRDGDVYRMWFSCRGNAYRIAYAESRDGLSWERKKDPAGSVSSGEWDAEMQAYPAVFDHDGRRYLLYNGNGYGRTGIGWAAAIASA